MQDILEKAINKFSYTLPSGQIVWAPYARNDDYSQNKSVVRGLGKSSPQEIGKAVDYIIRGNPDFGPEEIRAELLSGTLADSQHNYKGIDCSGFVYHVFVQVYKELYGTDFYKILSLPKEHVLNGAYKLNEWMQTYSIDAKEAADLPESVPLEYVVSNFKRNPQNLCRVTSLVSDYSSTPVMPEDTKPGDLLHLQKEGDPVPHISIVVSLHEDSIVVAHSTRKNQKDIGGVCLESITRSGPTINTHEMDTPRKLIGVRRLRHPVDK